jgi:(2Fe-2S) ferredoxin
MNELKFPYVRVLFVCTNTREGRAACGNAERGASSGEKTVEALKHAVKEKGLKGRIRVAKSGCMDLCGAGPNVMVFEEGRRICLSRVSEQDVPAIIEKYLA